MFGAYILKFFKLLNPPPNLDTPIISNSSDIINFTFLPASSVNIPFPCADIPVILESEYVKKLLSAKTSISS